jgi:hypothetical protein
MGSRIYYPTATAGRAIVVNTRIPDDREPGRNNAPAGTQSTISFDQAPFYVDSRIRIPINHAAVKIVQNARVRDVYMFGANPSARVIIHSATRYDKRRSGNTASGILIHQRILNYQRGSSPKSRALRKVIHNRKTG